MPWVTLTEDRLDNNNLKLFILERQYAGKNVCFRKKWDVGTL